MGEQTGAAWGVTIGREREVKQRNMSRRAVGAGDLLVQQPRRARSEVMDQCWSQQLCLTPPPLGEIPH